MVPSPRRSATRSGTEADAPEVIEHAGAMREASRRHHGEGRSVGLVPTMGALHAGHMRLIEVARAENDVVVVSVFVNPIQFGPNEDLERYPRDWDRDRGLLTDARVDVVYRPAVVDMYPAEATTRVRVGAVGEPLEGAARPGHFDGVATVVAKLLGAVEPDRAYFGQKDAQQVAVVERLVRDLDIGVDIRVVPTVREPDGLALSSRNVYLDAEERAAATSLSAALREATAAYARGDRDSDRLRDGLRTRLGARPLVRIDYADVVDPATFQSLPREIGANSHPLAVLAVRIGRTRLIDNHDLSQPFPG